MSKYKIGDKVLIKNNLKAYKQYGSEYFIPKMEDMRGRVATIKDIAKTDDTKYLLKEMKHRLYFTDEMILGKLGEVYYVDEDMTDIPLTEEENMVRRFMEDDDDMDYTLQDFLDEITDSVDFEVNWDKVIEDCTKELINRYTEYDVNEEVKSNSKYKVGDIVRIRKDLEYGEYYGSNSVNEEMLELLGQTAIIEEVVDFSNMLVGQGVEYKLIGSRYLWTDEMIICKIGEVNTNLKNKSTFEIKGRLTAYGEDRDIGYEFRKWCIENNVIFDEYK